MTSLFDTDKSIVLNIGSGSTSVHDFTHVFKGWKELRLDLYVESADIKCDIVSLESVPNNSVDAVWACHVIEHLEWYQLPETFRNIMRVLKSSGVAIVRVPDIGSIAHLIKEDLLTPVYTTDSGLDVCPIDMLYGHRGLQEHTQGQNHKIGFTLKSMNQILNNLNINAYTASKNYEIYAILYKDVVPTEILNSI